LLLLLERRRHRLCRRLLHERHEGTTHCTRHSRRRRGRCSRRSGCWKSLQHVTWASCHHRGGRRHRLRLHHRAGEASTRCHRWRGGWLLPRINKLSLPKNMCEPCLSC
jgi:hypothetical protein